jgi:hypothetical protein
MKTGLTRLGWVAMGTLAVALIGFSVRTAMGGSIDPPGPPGSTMQTLNNIPGSWSTWLPANNGGGDGCGSSRFDCVIPTAHCSPLCLFTNDAVLDHQTGLVWVRDAGVAGTGNWTQANVTCLNLKVAGVAGWRLPSIAEMMSVSDPFVVSPSVSLPGGNPFLNTGASGTHVSYWSSTADPSFAGNYFAGTLGHSSPGVGPLADSLVTSTVNSIWCVRGAVTQ